MVNRRNTSPNIEKGGCISFGSSNNIQGSPKARNPCFISLVEMEGG
jgi:hypothetical protein